MGRGALTAVGLGAFGLAAFATGTENAARRGGFFVDVTEATGLEHRHTSAPTEERLLREIMGGGVAVFDFDGDARLDILFPGAAPSGTVLYRQQADSTFVDATSEAGLATGGYGMGAALGDIDNDGDLDLLLTRVGPDLLYRNRGAGRFEDITTAAGLDNDVWSTSATFCDIDDDGFLDLYVAGYVETRNRPRCTTPAGVADYCPPNVHDPVADRLYRNLGDGSFRDISTSAGISDRRGAGLGVVCWDFTGDHRADIFVANDGTANHLWVNEGANRFVERGVELGVATNLFGESEAGMGVALGDVNDDQAMDLFLTHVDRETSTLYASSGGDVLLDATSLSGLGPASLPTTGFGVTFADFDSDGGLDLAVANGRVRRPARSIAAPESFSEIYGEENQLFRGDGRGRFEISCASDDFCNDSDLGRGLLAVDLDGDGDLDLVLANNNGRARIFENRGAGDSAWLGVRALGIDGRRDAIGATVVIEARGRRQVRPVVHTRSYLSSGAAEVHFGLGGATQLDSLEVEWPDGHQESFEPLPLNRRVVLVRGQGAGR